MSRAAFGQDQLEGHALERFNLHHKMAPARFPSPARMAHERQAVVLSAGLFPSGKIDAPPAFDGRQQVDQCIYMIGPDAAQLSLPLPERRAQDAALHGPWRSLQNRRPQFEPLGILPEWVTRPAVEDWLRSLDLLRADFG